MPENGHFQRMRPLVAGLAARGLDVHVMTHGKFAAQVREDGGRFFDLFDKYSLQRLGDDSLPVPSRFVTYAAAYAEPVADEVASIGARLVLHDSFAVIGRVTSDLLNLPRVNVCAGHNVVPERFIRLLRDDPRVRTSATCLRAVRRLVGAYGMEDASPFAYLSPPSPQLNICCEPPEFLDEAERRSWRPLAFFGSLRRLPSDDHHAGANAAHFADSGKGVLRLYVSFGTVIWRYYFDSALRALRALADAFAERPDVQAVISLGGSERARAARRELARQNVSVEDYVDQQAVLAQADLFVTHHGMNSTHEAIAHRVPMLSYPFFWDQPALARKCQELGLAVPLADTLRGRIDRAAVHRVLDAMQGGNETMEAALAKARTWEEDVMARRPEVIRQIAGLMA